MKSLTFRSAFLGGIFVLMVVILLFFIFKPIENKNADVENPWAYVTDSMDIECEEGYVRDCSGVVIDMPCFCKLADEPDMYDSHGRPNY